MPPSGYFDLVEAFAAPGCAVCALLERDVSHFLDSLLYERVTRPETHRTFRDARGLCTEHAWQLTTFKGSALSIAILYRAALEEALHILGDSPDGGDRPGLARLLAGGAGAQVADQLEPAADCPACHLLLESEAYYVQVLGRHLSDDQLAEAYRRSEGLCLPHVRQVLRQAGSAQRQVVLSVQQAVWQAVRDELKTFVDKYDYRRAEEPIGTERDSWLRAVRLMGGRRGIFSLRRGK
jgi:hypothetical protein